MVYNWPTVGLQLDLRLTFFTRKVSQHNWKSSAENLEAVLLPLVRYRILAQDLELSFTLKCAIFLPVVMGLYERLINGFARKDDKGVQKMHRWSLAPNGGAVLGAQ